jgi:hypothetical protein
MKSPLKAGDLVLMFVRRGAILRGSSFEDFRVVRSPFFRVVGVVRVWVNTAGDLRADVDDYAGSFRPGLSRDVRELIPLHALETLSEGEQLSPVGPISPVRSVSVEEIPEEPEIMPWEISDTDEPLREKVAGVSAPVPRLSSRPEREVSTAAKCAEKIKNFPQPETLAPRYAD